MRSDANLKTPMLQAHGIDDVVVDVKFAEQSYHALKKLNVNVEFNKYEDMGHEAFPQELDRLGEWIQERLGLQVTAENKPGSKEGEPKGNI
jgi:predicted esterase